MKKKDKEIKLDGIPDAPIGCSSCHRLMNEINQLKRELRDLWEELQEAKSNIEYYKELCPKDRLTKYD